MKFKITSTTLLYIFMVQIILIDLFVGVFLVKAIIKINHNNALRKVEEVRLIKAKKENTNGYVGRNFNMGKQTTAEFEKLKDEVLQEMFYMVYLKTPSQARDFKIGGDLHMKDGDFIATAYDLSYESCGKYPSNPAYGVTFSGKKAERGRTIAVDPGIIPLGSNVQIEFPKQYSFLNGWYIAEDTGSKVKYML